MMKLKLSPSNTRFTYQGKNIELKNFARNKFTGIWTFDAYWHGGCLHGVPISTGTNVVKGNGLPIFSFVFLDSVSQNGDLTVPDNATLYIWDEE